MDFEGDSIFIIGHKWKLFYLQYPLFRMMMMTPENNAFIRRMTIISVAVLCGLFSVGCISGDSRAFPSVTSENLIGEIDSFDVIDSINLSMFPDSLGRYFRQFPLIDGDDVPDTLFFFYSNGAHCCYNPVLILTDPQQRYDFPFNVDGTLSFYEDSVTVISGFRVRDFDLDGKYTVYLIIETYNVSKGPIPKEWRQKWGIETNDIAIEVKNGKLIVRDQQENERLYSHGYLSKRDFDGDGMDDRIEFAFTEGDPSYYSLQIRLSGKKGLHIFPFEAIVSNHYLLQDSSEPEMFRIEDSDGDGKDEILMWIDTVYSKEHVAAEVRKKGWHFKTDHIVIEIENGKFVVRDQTLKEWH